MSQRLQNWLILLGVAALTLIADRLSKVLVASNLALNKTWDLPVPLLTRVFRVTYTTNTGAAFGLFPNQGGLFIIIAFIVIATIIYYYRHLPDGYGLLRVALGLQLGGALGNLIDRLRQGYVIDFIDFNFWPLQDWPVFNLADSAIVVGVVLLAATMLFEDVEEERAEAFSSSRDTAGEPDPPYPARNSSSSRDSL